MSKKISVDDLAWAVVDELNHYEQQVTDGVKESVRQVAEECRDEIKANSPVRKGKGGGAYKRSWSDTVRFESREDIRVVVYNKRHYRLTHLLENGHALAGGGTVDAIPHIRPAEQHAAEKLMNKVKVKIKGSG